MKARLLQFEGSLQLLLCNGKILMLSYPEAFEFISNFDNQDYYAGPGTWDYENITMESYRGTTIAVVSDDGLLTIENAELLREILDRKDVKYLTSTEYAALHGKKDAIIRRLCRTDRIPGAILKGKTWLIPNTSPYPADERGKSRGN